MSNERKPMSIEVFEEQEQLVLNYKAHVFLTQGREMTKARAMNELIALGALEALPDKILKSLEFDARALVASEKKAA